MLNNYFTPPPQGQTILTALLTQAKTSVRAWIYSINLQSLAEALITLHTHGIDVQCVCDPETEVAANQPIKSMCQAGIACWTDHTVELMHTKACLIDATTLVTGSWNWTTQADNEQDNALLITDDPTTCAAYAANWQQIQERSEPWRIP